MLKSCSLALSLQTFWDPFQDTLDLYTRPLWSQVLLLSSFNQKGRKRKLEIRNWQKSRWMVVLGVEGSSGSVEPGFTLSGSHGQSVTQVSTAGRHFKGSQN